MSVREPETRSELGLSTLSRVTLPPARGELLRLIPHHVCPTVNLAEEALLVDDGELSVAAVSARSHDLFVRSHTRT